ncbi:Protein pacG [Pleurostoma richardsiae]|uniref:Protein pacG n=1 Tax=Pleurostoma richardsiae TaxID=41990 RepID=A0AA38RZA2_9PEZI|nr:Protein pacG [Pleurostoma richardsiae]
MATFNSMPALSSGATPAGDALGLSAAGQALGIEGFDQDITFDDSILDGVNGLGQLPFTPSQYDFEPFSTTFEDPFSYPARPFADVPGGGGGGGGGVGLGAMLPHHHHHPDAGGGEVFNDGESPPNDQLDNKLLGFSAPIARASLVDEDTGAFADVGMAAELYGMFFVAEDVFGGDSASGRPLELTCYRRNLWQCSGQVTLPRRVAHAVVGEQGDRQVRLVELSASITAIESIEGKSTEIISIPWKSANAPAAAATATSTPAPGSGGGGGGSGADEAAKVAAAPPQVPLDLAAGVEADGNRVTLPVSWKRLQFKHATANNGRRKGLQQHYVVQINLLGRTEAGEVVKIAEIQSGPVIVRGRSPRNFDSRKDVPLTGDKKMERRGTTASSDNGSGGGSIVAATTAPAAAAIAPVTVAGPAIKEHRGDLAQNLQRYHSLGNIQSSGDWTQPYGQQSPHPAKKMALTSPSLARPPVPSWSSDQSIKPVPSTPRGNHRSSAAAPPTLPINLSLSEDERSPNRSGSDSTSPQFAKAVPAGKGNPSGSPVESADLLYEYFPLSLDDWMPPVDAIYRPHVVHHTLVPPEIKAQQVRNKTKRYFAAD